jgi:hypothetical protein
MILLFAAGAILGGAGLLAIGFGIPIKDTSFGNAILLSGIMLLCTSLVLIGLALVVRELQAVARALAQGAVRVAPRGAAPARQPAPRLAQPATDPALPPLAADGAGAEPHWAPSAPPPWAAEAAARERTRAVAPPAAEPAVESPVPPAPAAPPERPRRNLLFATRRRDRAEQASAGSMGDQPLPAELPPMAPPVLPPKPALEAEPRASFETAWPASRDTDAFGRRNRGADAPAAPAPPAAEPSHSEPAPEPVAPPVEPAPAVTVIKSGVVDGMAYSLYSDGSIEAQMPEGMLRFASLDELRSHLDQRP